MALVAVIITAEAGAAIAAKSDPAASLPAGALKDAPSLYLREAASDRVRWQRWGAASLELARTLKRPVLLDIGAVWCHWCHVMDQTTYADAKVAEVINRRLVPIKVDADERPDVDGYYQDAAEAFGAGGWPLTAFVTPDGAPMLIVGYLPPKDSTGHGIIDLLTRVADAYAHDPELPKMGREVAARLAAEAAPANRPHGSAPALRELILHALSASYDHENGGFGRGPGPRFFDFPALELALAHGFFGHPEFTAIALDSLRKIAAGAVYDQLGSGFHRYSTDPAWRVPHFEKMLYDQAMALAAYAHAYQASGEPEFARVARDTIGYANRTLLDPATHTFYSHQDADAFAGDDGSYYTWTRDEVERALKPDQARAALLYFGFDNDPARAPDGRIVLRRALSVDQVASRLKLSRAATDRLLANAIAAMEAARDRRRKPMVDQALLVDRNALMARAYLIAASALGDHALERIALDDLNYIMSHARAADGSFYHSYSNSKAQVPGLVADQVYVLRAMVAAYQASADPRYLQQSRVLADLIMGRFLNPATGLLCNRGSDAAGTVLAEAHGRIDVVFDRPMPSAQAGAALALDELAALTSDKRYESDASRLLAAASRATPGGAGTMLATLGRALEARADGETVVAVVGEGADARALRDTALKTYRPAKVVMLLDSQAARAGALPATAQAMLAATLDRKRALAFVCAGTACAKPVSNPAALAALIRRFGVGASSRVARRGDL